MHCDFDGSYLSLCMESKECDYRLNMLTFNNIKGLLLAKYKNVNNKRFIQYDYASKTPLAEYLKIAKMDEEGIKRLIIDLDRVVNNASMYLLPKKGLCLDINYIFVNANGGFEFIYNPYGNSDFFKELYELFLGVLPYIDHDNHKTVLMAYGLMDVMDTPNVTMGDLISFVNRIESEYTEFKGDSKDVGMSIEIAAEDVPLYGEKSAGDVMVKKDRIKEGFKKKIADIIKKEKQVKEKSKYKERPKLVEK